MRVEPMQFEEILDHLENLKGWDEVNQDYIKKSFHFPDFRESLTFVNRIAKIAEMHNHYPKFILSEGKVVIKLFTVESEGLTNKDFELARLIDELFEEQK